MQHVLGQQTGVTTFMDITRDDKTTVTKEITMDDCMNYHFEKIVDESLFSGPLLGKSRTNLKQGRTLISGLDNTNDLKMPLLCQ